MAPESEKGTGANAATTASGSAPALGGANIRRLQVGGCWHHLGMSGLMFFPGKNQVLEANKKQKKKNMKITRIKHVFFFLKHHSPFGGVPNV